jgi:uncharacterized protein with beta-barrel porin domain
MIGDTGDGFVDPRRGTLGCMLGAGDWANLREPCPQGRGGGFGLSYNAMSATDVCTEIGSRFEDATSLDNMPLVSRGKLAWAHDFVDNPTLSAAFESLPGTGFIVNGAPIPHNSALVSGGAELFLAPHLSIQAKFDGEFAGNGQTYGGTGTIKYTW